MVFEDIEANLNPNLANLIPVIPSYSKLVPLGSGIQKLVTQAYRA